MRVGGRLELDIDVVDLSYTVPNRAQKEVLPSLKFRNAQRDFEPSATEGCPTSV